MSSLVAFVILATVGGLLVWLVLKGRELERRRDLERKVLARKQDWQYDGQRSGRVEYRFAGDANGVEWQMWYDSDRGDKSPTPRAYWTSANLRTPDLALVIIGRKRFKLESGTAGRLLMGVVSGVVNAMSGQEARVDKAEFYESAVEITTGRTAFREAYAVAVTPDLPTSWMDEELQTLLLDWPAVEGTANFRAADNVEVTLQADGLRIVVQNMPQDIRIWLHLAALGQHLARQLAGARGG